MSFSNKKAARKKFFVIQSQRYAMAFILSSSPPTVAPVDNHGFWIGCWDTQEQATKEAEKPGLKVMPI